MFAAVLPRAPWRAFILSCAALGLLAFAGLSLAAEAQAGGGDGDSQPRIWRVPARAALTNPELVEFDPSDGGSYVVADGAKLKRVSPDGLTEVLVSALTNSRPAVEVDSDSAHDSAGEGGEERQYKNRRIDAQAEDDSGSTVEPPSSLAIRHIAVAESGDIYFIVDDNDEFHSLRVLVKATHKVESVFTQTGIRVQDGSDLIQLAPRRVVASGSGDIIVDRDAQHGSEFWRIAFDSVASDWTAERVIGGGDEDPPMLRRPAFAERQTSSASDEEDFDDQPRFNPRARGDLFGADDDEEPSSLHDDEMDIASANDDDEPINDGLQPAVETDLEHAFVPFSTSDGIGLMSAPAGQIRILRATCRAKGKPYRICELPTVTFGDGSTNSTQAIQDSDQSILIPVVTRGERSHAQLLRVRSVLDRVENLSTLTPATALTCLDEPIVLESGSQLDGALVTDWDWLTAVPGGGFVASRSGAPVFRQQEQPSLWLIGPSGRADDRLLAMVEQVRTHETTLSMKVLIIKSLRRVASGLNQAQRRLMEIKEKRVAGSLNANSPFMYRGPNDIFTVIGRFLGSDLPTNRIFALQAHSALAILFDSPAQCDQFLASGN